MPLTIAQTSKETVSSLIRKEFDNIDITLEYITGNAKRLIQTAKDFGLTELAEQMQNDLEFELN